jgi:hypothetical protein
MNTPSTVSENLRRVIEANSRLWAGEAEVFRTYWTWDKRTRETDRQWLAYQCYKEVWSVITGDPSEGLFMGTLKRIEKMFPKIDDEIDRHTVLDEAEGLWAEFAHYCAFADAYDAMGKPGEAKMNPRLVKGRGWKADEELGRVRHDHRKTYGEIGEISCKFTEGGYCTLFSEGMKLSANPAGHDGRDGIIAEACGKVYDDEFGHMLKGVVGIDKLGLTAEQWALFEKITVEQLKMRILMRNDQFGKPLSDKRIREIFAGDIKPIAFDYEQAKLAA